MSHAAGRNAQRQLIVTHHPGRMNDAWIPLDEQMVAENWQHLHGFATLPLYIKPSMQEIYERRQAALERYQ